MDQMSFLIGVCVRVCACVHACVRVCSACACMLCGVSLSKEFYSRCSSPPSCINGDLAIAGEANGMPCMSHLMRWNFGCPHHHP